jgi:hypothetical protein
LKAETVLLRPHIIGDVASTDTTLKLWIEIFTS